MTRIALANFDAAEAFETILKHEKIDYEKAIGCGFIAFDIEDVNDVSHRLYQWDVALMRVLEALRSDPDFQLAYARNAWPSQKARLL